MTLSRQRSRVARVLRPAFEWILLGGSLIAGLGIVGSCAAAGSGGAGAGFAALNIVGGLLFAVALVGAVYLLATMSRDLRHLRERYVEADTPSAPEMETAGPGDQPQAGA